MAPRPSLAITFGALARWPFGIALTSWHYMWRTTVLHRRERSISAAEELPPDLPEGARLEHILRAEDGVGPLFARRYRTSMRKAVVTPAQLAALVAQDLNRCAPTEFARFRKLSGPAGAMRVGDEYLVHMPGPWNGPVRVIETTPMSFRLATLAGHLEAGQIEFRCASSDAGLVFEIESWARSADRLSNLLYAHLRMAKEVQLHMWISFLERVVELSGGRMTGGIEIETRRVDDVTR